MTFNHAGGEPEHIRATAEKPAAAGFTVAGVDRSEEGLKELPDGIWREAAQKGCSPELSSQGPQGPKMNEIVTRKWKGVALAPALPAARCSPRPAPRG